MQQNFPAQLCDFLMSPLEYFHINPTFRICKETVCQKRILKKGLLETDCNRSEHILDITLRRIYNSLIKKAVKNISSIHLLSVFKNVSSTLSHSSNPNAQLEVNDSVMAVYSFHFNYALVSVTNPVDSSYSDQKNSVDFTRTLFNGD